MISAGKPARCADSIKRQHYMEPALRVHIEITARVGDRRTGSSCRAIERRRVTVERVEVDYTAQWMTRCLVDTQYRVHRFENEAVTNAQTLIRWLNRELVSVIGQALLPEIETIEAETAVGARFVLLVVGGVFSFADPFGDAAVGDTATAVAATAVAVADGAGGLRLWPVGTGKLG